MSHPALMGQAFVGVFFAGISVGGLALVRQISKDPWMRPTIAQELRPGESHRQLFERLAASRVRTTAQ